MDEQDWPNYHAQQVHDSGRYPDPSAFFGQQNVRWRKEQMAPARAAAQRRDGSTIIFCGKSTKVGNTNKEPLQMSSLQKQRCRKHKRGEDNSELDQRNDRGPQIVAPE